MMNLNPLKMMAAVLLAAAVAVSCDKNNRDGKENPHLVGNYPNDDVELLVNQIVALDEDGEIVHVRGGLQLDESDPGKITIVAEDYEAARKYFKDLIPEGADNFENGDNLVWNLKDTLGVKKGQAVFKKVTGAEDGRVAEIEVPVSARPLTSVVFIPKSAVPLNDDYFDIANCDALDSYYLGAMVTIKKDQLPEGSYMEGKNFGRGTGDFVVIQDYEPGSRDGVLIRLETKEHNYITNGSDSDSHRRRSSFEWDLKKVHDVLKANPSLHSNMKDAKMNDWDHSFMCRKNNSDNNDYRYNIKDGNGLEKLYFFGGWYYYEALIYSFHVEETSVPGEYGVEITYW